MKCQEPFNSITKRRHHCRACGHVGASPRTHAQQPRGRQTRLCMLQPATRGGQPEARGPHVARGTVYSGPRSLCDNYK